MQRFTIVPVDKSHSPIEVLALDAGLVLPIIDRLHCGPVNVLRNKIFAFSAEPDSTGFWSIFSRPAESRISVAQRLMPRPSPDQL